MVSIGIIGYGMVGRAIHSGFAKQYDFRIYDIDDTISENTFEEVSIDSDYIFVCVPTPMKSTGQFDSSILDYTIDKLNEYVKDTDKIVIIKSTCLPGTTKGYQEKYPNSHIVFSPEFLTVRSARLDFINPSRIIFGLDQKNYERNQWEMNVLYELYHPRFPSYNLHFTDATTAELVKYVSNCFFATKVSFFNEMKQISDALGVSYPRLLKYVLKDGRIGNSHWEVPGHDMLHGFGGQCFPKDLNALIHLEKELGINPTMLDAVWKKNLEVREKRDWEENKSAFTSD
jgi:nucleotide sugar dehydrogenase